MQKIKTYAQRTLILSHLKKYHSSFSSVGGSFPLSLSPHEAIQWLTTILFRPATQYLACIEEHLRQATHTKTEYHIFTQEKWSKSWCIFC